jgi:hypothetical protein
MPNAFLPWHRVGAEAQNGSNGSNGSKVKKRFAGVKKAAEAINA